MRLRSGPAARTARDGSGAPEPHAAGPVRGDGPVDLADARAVFDLDRESLDLELLRRLAQRFGRDAARIVEDLLGAVDE